MIITQNKVKGYFKDADMRVPANFMSQLDSLVTAIVKSAVEANGLIRQEAVKKLANEINPTMGRHVAMAYERIKGTSEENTGTLFQVARQIAQEEKTKPRI